MAFRTATGRVEAFGHLATIETLGLNFESLVYFFADERINKSLLGRLGWPRAAFASASSIMTGCLMWRLTIKRRYPRRRLHLIMTFLSRSGSRLGNQAACSIATSTRQNDATVRLERSRIFGAPEKRTTQLLSPP